MGRPANRDAPERRGLVGFFVNTLVLPRRARRETRPFTARRSAGCGGGPRGPSATSTIRSSGSSRRSSRCRGPPAHLPGDALRCRTHRGPPRRASRGPRRVALGPRRRPARRPFDLHLRRGEVDPGGRVRRFGALEPRRPRSCFDPTTCSRRHRPSLPQSAGQLAGAAPPGTGSASPASWTVRPSAARSGWWNGTTPSVPFQPTARSTSSSPPGAARRPGSLRPSSWTGRLTYAELVASGPHRRSPIDLRRLGAGPKAGVGLR